MRKTLLVKALVTGILATIVIVPLTAIENIVHDRQAASTSVLADVQRAGVGTQTLIGPILVVPYRRTVQSETTDPQTGRKSTVTNEDEGRQYLLPDSLTADVRVSSEMRYRGIYSALLYNAHHTITGSFAVPERFGVAESPNVSYAFSPAYLILGISDTRGIRGTPAVNWNGAALEWKGGTEGSAIQNGVHAQIGNVTPAKTASFTIDIALQGTQGIEYVPVGKETAIEMRSDWPHPSFDGQFLPETRTVTTQGFDAKWRTTLLASNVESTLRARLEGKSDTQPNTLGVAFIEPVNVYLQTERAAKYGFLFVVLTFLVFQLFELLKGLAIHPVQYGLVGTGLAMFFLLLLALTEHVPFAIAYLIASAVCIGLLGFYVSYVLRSMKRATGFTGLLTTLYGALYVLLRSEDMALLLGAVLLFGILAAIMVVTRHVDWYGIAADPTDGGVTGAGASR